jgi:hypothetical protein
MTKKKIFIILAAVLFAVAVLSIAITMSHMFFRPYGRQEVLTPEHAVQIARAAIIQRYGEAEIEDMEFWASDSWWPYWRVSEGSEADLRLSLGYPPVVYVRRYGGMVILLWRTDALTRMVGRVLFG